MGALQNLCLLTLLFLGAIAAQIKSSRAAEDAIAVGKTLSGIQSRSSANGVYRLGFFPLVGTANWYAGIWYAQMNSPTAVWLINVDRPLQDNLAVLNLTENGSLVLSNGSLRLSDYSVIWASNGTSKPASTANITNEGNLVVYGAHNRSEILWQSFDYPQNTWIPGMKISEMQRLTSWKSPWDPTPGLYNLLLDKQNDQLILQGRNSIKYWESGGWNGQIFSKVPELTQDLVDLFDYFNNGTYKYFTYSLKPGVTVRTRLVMSESGDIMAYAGQLDNTDDVWTMFWTQPRDQCQVYALCGAYGTCTTNNVQFCSCLTGFTPSDERSWEAQAWSGECKRRRSLECGETSTDGFMEVTANSLPVDAVAVAGSASEQNCRSGCLSNCSCTAYAYDGTLCNHWLGELLNLTNSSSSSTSLFVRLAASDVPRAPPTKNQYIVLITIKIEDI
ncbi:hypothetical protein SUGI_0659340 [Cryptomeria japonica]|uniref:G-type lectin S-receptor-like serine/threonine-protein kinase At2g19130 n=1 Tax=Cryptomeria japonica TaxID=3369 RepID=UPI002414C616|nr:G-type lectin S-receptor-like serine/threonine-protein kinase At2g19130 [Cryptomeria japonica]GLJ32750.1 hypothetical protein SUGI_0659340 [Cryptomeria japonica]